MDMFPCPRWIIPAGSLWAVDALSGTWAGSPPSGRSWPEVVFENMMAESWTAKFKQWSEPSYYGFGVFVANGWIIQSLSFSCYAATMAYPPSHKLAVAVSTTVRE